MDIIQFLNYNWLLIKNIHNRDFSPKKKSVYLNNMKLKTKNYSILNLPLRIFKRCLK